MWIFTIIDLALELSHNGFGMAFLRDQNDTYLLQEFTARLLGRYVNIDSTLQYTVCEYLRPMMSSSVYFIDFVRQKAELFGIFSKQSFLY